MADSLESFSAIPVGHTGTVALLGRPNTGKSTLVNTVLACHLAPVTDKPQTTRRNCLGIHTTDTMQILFLDAPGVHIGRDALDEAMDRAVKQTLEDCDLVLVVCDPTRAPGTEDRLVAERAAHCGKPVFLALNKSDLTTPEQRDDMRAFYAGHLPETQVFHICARRRDSLDPLLQCLAETLPQGPFVFPVEQLTSASERDLAVELIREALLELLREEIPHATAVTIDTWSDAPDHSIVQATLHVERDNHKRILIGRKGSMVKRLKQEASKRLEALCERPVDLTLWVKVTPHWRRNPRALKEFRFHAQG